MAIGELLKKRLFFIFGFSEEKIAKRLMCNVPIFTKLKV